MKLHGRTRLEVARDPAQAAEFLADFTESRAREAIGARGRFSLALSGGSTPRPFYHALARRDLSWPDVHVFLVDERAVPPTDPESNFRMIKEALLDHVSIPPAQIHRIVADDGDARTAAEAYQRTLVRSLGSSGALDLVLLGVGTDGHTASLFPGGQIDREEAPDATPWVAATHAPLGSPVRERVTLTLEALEAAREIVFLVTGEEKAAILRRVLVDRGDLPAQLVLQRREGRALVVVDRLAGSMIEEERD